MKGKIPPYYRLIKEHPHSYEMHDGKDGRSFHIAKHGLHSSMHSRIAKIPRYAKGTPEVKKHVSDWDYMVNELDNKEAQQARFEKDQASLGKTPEAPSTPQGTSSTQSVVPDAGAGDASLTTGSASGSTTDIPSTTQEINPLDKSSNIKPLQEEQQAYKSANQAEQKAAKQKAGAYKEFLEEEQTVPNPMEIQLANQEKSNELYQQFRDKQIDPDRIFKNMGLGTKIVRALGLIFGGLGAGAKGENPGLTMLQEDIDRDIAAQKNAQDKALNLYKINRQEVQDDIQATLLTKEQMLLALKAKIDQFGAEAAGPVAAAQRAKLISDLDLQINAINRKRAFLTAAQGDGVIGADPVQMLEDVPEKFREKAAEEINHAKKVKTLYDDMSKAQLELEELAIGGHLSYKQRDALINAYTPQVSKLFAGRYTESDAKSIVSAFFKTGIEGAETTAKRRELLESAFKAEGSDSHFRAGTNIGLDRFEATRIRSPKVKTEEQIKEYINKNKNSSDPQVKRRIQFLINRYGITP